MTYSVVCLFAAKGRIHGLQCSFFLLLKGETKDSNAGCPLRRQKKESRIPLQAVSLDAEGSANLTTTDNSFSISVSLPAIPGFLWRGSPETESARVTTVSKLSKTYKASSTVLGEIVKLSKENLYM